MKILFTTPVLEHPAAGGPQLRIENSIIALNKISELHVISRVDRNQIGGEEAETFYTRNCRNFSYSPSVSNLNKNKFIRKFQRVFRRFFCDDSKFIIDYINKNDISIIWYGYGNISFDMMKKIKSERPGVKVVCDTDSVWSKFVLRELPFEKDPARKAKIESEGRKKEAEEKEWVNLCEVTTAVSEVDAEYYRSIAKDKSRIKIFSNVINLDSYTIKPKQPEGFLKPCVYLAGTFWPGSPMEKAARWIIDEVMPLIKSKKPETHLYIIGNGSDKILSDIKEPKVTVTGKLRSVLPYLCNADVAIVPLMFESGTRFKILEAGACGVPLVSTTLGAEGIPVKNNEDILIADGAVEFADAIIKIIENKKLGEQLSGNCRELIKSNYSIDSLTKEAKNILEYLKYCK